MTRALAVALVLVAACEPKVRPEYPEPTWEDDERAGAAVERPVTARAAPLRVAEGTLTRARLVAVLDQGPPAFLRGVDIEPAFSAERFAGWRILSFWPDEPLFQDVDLVPGDVVVRVNGRSLERPEQFQELWESLRTATVLEVDYLRHGAPRKLHYDIQN